MTVSWKSNGAAHSIKDQLSTAPEFGDERAAIAYSEAFRTLANAIVISLANRRRPHPR